MGGQRGLCWFQSVESTQYRHEMLQKSNMGGDPGFFAVPFRVGIAVFGAKSSFFRSENGVITKSGPKIMFEVRSSEDRGSEFEGLKLFATKSFVILLDFARCQPHPKPSSKCFGTVSSIFARNFSDSQNFRF